MKLVIYNLLILLLIPIFQLRILIKSYRDRGYRANFAHRYGRNFTTINRQKKKLIWFHAVSLGEVIGSQDVIRLMLKHYDVVLTTTTPTGFRKAQEIYKDSIAINYAPWDLNILIQRFIKFYQPEALLIFETEIWPAMISTTYKKHIPIFLINARLSLKSYKAYSKVSWLLQDIMQMITFVFAQTPRHLERFIQLGIKKEQINIRIADLNGRVLLNNKSVIYKGSNLLNLNTEDLAKGFYILNIYSNNGNTILSDPEKCYLWLLK